MTVTELFPIILKLPEGFLYHENFLTVDEETSLLNIIKHFELRPMLFQGFEAKRKVASFGYDYSFDKKQLIKGKAIPSEFGFIVSKVASHLSVPTDVFVELLITEYPIGSVINWHRDAPPFDIIVGISLLSDCTFRLRPHAKERQTRKSTLSFPVKRRSLYRMSGIAREEWQHATSAVSEVRYSLTLRTLRLN
jgi:alkylated DNA repair dioxygenase AlkB